MTQRYNLDHAIARSYRLLQHRLRSTREVRDRLRTAGFPATVVDEAVGYLVQQGLLDDEAFARTWAEERRALKPRSKRLIRKELNDKGIPPDLADRVTRDIDDDAVALELARRKAETMRGLEYTTFMRRLSRYLYSRGFSHSSIVRAAGRIRHEHDVS